MQLEVIFAILAIVTVICNIVLNITLWRINNRKPLIYLAKGVTNGKMQSKEVCMSCETCDMVKNYEH